MEEEQARVGLKKEGTPSRYINCPSGWVDDFRALPGICGSPVSRKLLLAELLRVGIPLRKLHRLGFSQGLVKEALEVALSEEYSSGRLRDS